MWDFASLDADPQVETSFHRIMQKARSHSGQEFYLEDGAAIARAFTRCVVRRLVVGERGRLILSPDPLVTIDAEHFGFKLGPVLAKALSCFAFYETHLNKVAFGPMLALGIEMPLRI